jgi:diguanylate cyclase (GGDEF)-like protein/PAS domain S-box-containing protein
MRVLRGLSADYQPELSSALEIYDLESRAKVAAAIEAAKTLGKDFELELRMVRQNGDVFWVRATGWVEMENGKPAHLFGAIQDISERVRRQEQLSAAHLRMVLALEGGGIGVWEMNPATQDLTWDRQMFCLFGHFEDVPATNPNLLAQEGLHPEDRILIEAKLAVSAQEKSRFSAEYRVIWSDGSVHHLKSIADYIEDHTSDEDVLLGLTWDVTELRRLASELAEQSELLRVTLRSIGDAVITTDGQGVVTWLNPIAEKMTAWSTEDARGQPIEAVFKIVHEDTLEPVPNTVRETLENHQNMDLTLNAILISNTGASYGIEGSASLILDDANEIKGAILVFQDVTSQRQISRDMAYRATHDTLTGTANRTVLQNHLDVLIARVQGGDGPHSLMYIDLDNFKRINDDCGHAAGDQVLQQVSAIFIDTIRSLDLLARVGGDEFAILLEHCSVEDAAKIAQKICDRMETYRYSFASKHYRIGASIGVVEVAPEWKLPEMIMQAADSACLVAKETGRNRVHIWRDLHAVLEQRQNEIGWLARLEQAFDGDLFRLMAQKISPLDPQTTGVCAEILLRIARPDGTYFQPEQFLPSAERFKMIDQIDRWVLSETVRVLQGQPDLADINTISLNISGISVADPSFHLHALAICKAAGPAVCQRLALEITETSAVANLHLAANFIEKLHDLGVRVWLDDFGAGSASFGYLRALKVDCLNIDGQFVQGLLDDPLSQVTVGACVEVAKVLGISTVAEYVEDQAVLNKLKTFGVNFVQGFLIAKPMPFEVFLEGGGAPPSGGSV